ncbi:MAG: hypothetical protein ACP5IE_06175 [Infirmifilum sp.]
MSKDVYVQINSMSIFRRSSECVASLIEKGAKVRLYRPKAGFHVLASFNAPLARHLVNFHHNVRCDMIYSLHETAYEMALAVSLGEYFDVPKATLLQLPPLLEGSRFERVQRSMEFQRALLGLLMFGGGRCW